MQLVDKLLKVFVKSLRYQILTLATTHLLISYFMMVTRDYNQGNLFLILNYTAIFPEIGSGLDWFIISNIFAVGFFFVFFIPLLVHELRKRSRQVTKSPEKS